MFLHSYLFVPIFVNNYFYMIEIIRAACSILPATELTFLSLHMYLYLKGSTQPKIHITWEKVKIKVVRNWILSKKDSESICLFPTGVEQGAQKMSMFEVLFCQERANYIHLRVQHSQKFASHRKKLKIKIVQNWITSKKVSERICLSPSRVELGGSKDWHVRSIIL